MFGQSHGAQTTDEMHVLLCMPWRLAGRLKLMTKRLAQRIDRRKRSVQADQDESRIPINRETAEIIAQQKKLFREQFGRDPGPDDPLFFDPSVVVAQFLSVTETNAQFLTDAELQEWHYAVDEYRQRIEAGETQ